MQPQYGIALTGSRNPRLGEADAECGLDSAAHEFAGSLNQQVMLFGR